MKLNFRLSTLMVFTTLVALALAVVILSRRNAELKNQFDLLSSELGYLVIDNQGPSFEGFGSSQSYDTSVGQNVTQPQRCRLRLSIEVSIRHIPQKSLSASKLSVFVAAARWIVFPSGNSVGCMTITTATGESLRE